MKVPIAISAVAMMLQPASAALTVEWGSLIPSAIVDSEGNALDGSFTFQLGFFQQPFSPSADNASDWDANWGVFDQAVYSEELGYFTGVAGINGDGTSTSVFADQELGLNFVGRQAYVWVFNSRTPGPVTQWFLARAESWVFPQGNDDCCDPSAPVEWSLSDLDNGSVVPVWGAQMGQAGAGDYTTTSPSFDLQTFTVVPEPSALAFLLVAASGLVLRRKRGSRVGL